MIRTKICMS